MIKLNSYQWEQNNKIEKLNVTGIPHIETPNVKILSNAIFLWQGVFENKSGYRTILIVSGQKKHAL